MEPILAQDAFDGVELVAVGEFSEDIAAGALEQGLSPKGIHAFPDRKSIAALLKEVLREGDMVLVKGSRGIALENVVKELGF